MAVMPGYKQTEVGVIPVDWEVRQFADHFRIYAGGDVPKHSLSNTQSPAHPYPIFANALSSRGLYGYTAERRASGNSVTITARGYLGHAEYRNEPFFPIVHLLVLEPTGKLDAQFTAYAVNELVEFAIESTGVPQLTAPQVAKYAIASPPTLEEQRAIATGLSDVDALLDGLERLIAKKREVRNTTKRQLLAGETRVPGFKDQWEATSFANVVRHHAGNSTLIKGKLPSSDAAGLYPAYSASGQDVWCAHFEHEGNAVVVSAVGSRCGKAFAASGKWSAIANTHVVWPITSKIDPDLLGFFINDEDFWLKSGTGQPFVLFSQTFARPLLLPPLNEQTAIARVLLDMDAELAALEARRDKTRSLKKAMMQELLTGRTRLVDGGARV
jgi:type I restriction enzyme S subunit